MTPEELKQVDDMFVVDNMRFEGLANNKLTPEKLKDFISSIIEARESMWRDRCLEIVESQNQNEIMMQKLAHNDLAKEYHAGGRNSCSAIAIEIALIQDNKQK